MAALAAHGLDNLSPPELAVAVHELTQDRRAFQDLLARASGYPSRLFWPPRRPDPDLIDRLDRELPASRVIIRADEPAIDACLASFDAVLVLDPFWSSTDLLYDTWHAPTGITSRHASRLLAMLEPAIRVSARPAVVFVPDHLPGSWTPFPLPRAGRSMTATGIGAGSEAARLLFWADRLRAVAATSDPRTGDTLRELACAGPDLRGCEASASVVHLPIRFPDVFDGHLPAPGNAAGEAWQLGVGASALPDVSLVLRRLRDGRPVRAGFAGQAFPLRRRAVFLVRSA